MPVECLGVWHACLVASALVIEWFHGWASICCHQGDTGSVPSRFCIHVDVCWPCWGCHAHRFVTVMTECVVRCCTDGLCLPRASLVAALLQGVYPGHLRFSVSCCWMCGTSKISWYELWPDKVQRCRPSCCCCLCCLCYYC